jgi:hypothetical protein
MHIRGLFERNKSCNKVSSNVCVENIVCEAAKGVGLHADIGPTSLYQAGWIKGIKRRRCWTGADLKSSSQYDIELYLPEWGD